MFSCVRAFFWLFFFFQAEDGIRDDLVTGVQTCALPILAKLAADCEAIMTNWVKVPESIIAAAPRSESTRLNSSHQINSYAVFCLKKKKRDNPLVELDRAGLQAREA